MESYGLNPSKLANAVNLNQTTLRLILSGKGKISCLVALKFAKFFGKTPEYWLNLQNQYDIAEAAKDKELTAALKNIKKATKAAPPKKGAKDTASKKKAAAEKDAPKAKRPGRPAADSKKTAKAVSEKASGSRKAAKAATADKAPAAGSRKTAKPAVDKALAAKKPAAGAGSKKPAVKKPAAEKKAADSKPAGAKRGRKPKSETAVPAPEPDPEFTHEYSFGPDPIFTPEPAIESDDYTFMSEPGSGFQEGTSETPSDFSLPETAESGEELDGEN
jgi:addiction module HigA family antidote